jgi:hypothetical protein
MEVALVWRLGAELGPAATAFANVCRQNYPGISPVDQGQI